MSTIPRQGGSPAPSVGDTLTIVQRIAAPPGAVVQARGPADSMVATLVAPPLVQREGDSVRIAYTVALWAPGRSDLRILGPIVIPLRGRVDTLADAHAAVVVRSLLPTGREPGRVPPRAPGGWVPRSDESLLPFAVLIPIAIGLLALLAWRWRRRGRAPAATEAAPMPVIPVQRVEQWIAAGEVRLALEHLEAASASLPGFEAWREAAESLRFSVGHEAELADLAREGVRRLHEAGTP